MHEVLQRLVSRWPIEQRYEFEERVAIMTLNGMDEDEAVTKAFEIVGADWQGRVEEKLNAKCLCELCRNREGEKR